MIPLFVIIYKLFLTIRHPSYWATLKLFLPINLVLINNTLFFYFEIFPEEYLHLVYLWLVGNQTKWSIVCHEIDLALFQQVTSFEVFVALLRSESFIVCLFVCYLTGPVQHYFRFLDRLSSQPKQSSPFLVIVMLYSTWIWSVLLTQISANIEALLAMFWVLSNLNTMLTWLTIRPEVVNKSVRALLMWSGWS